MGELPLDDPRWISLQTAIELRQHQTGDKWIALGDLERGLASDQLRCWRRNIASNKCEEVRARFWTALDFDFGPGRSRRFGAPDFPRVTIRERSVQRAADCTDGWAYYVWRPDLDRLYAQPQRKTKSKRKPGDVGRPVKFDPEQQRWLQERYRLDVEANPRLAKKLRDVAVPHVQQLAKTEYEIIAGRDVVLEDVIRPVLERLKRKSAR